MSNSGQPYHEKLLHWIWKSRQIACQKLATCSGHEVIIHEPGTPNKSDGPDFNSAEITIGKLRWFGDVEIHWNLADWKAHGHHTDANFNNVVLHVVFFKETNSTVFRQDGTSIPTLCLAPYLSKPLQSFVEQYRSEEQIPCAGQLSFISEKAFLQQLQKAHKEYFEQKVDDLLKFYDPGLSPSSAWKKMFTTALFDGLGISHNRKPMQQLAAVLWPELPNISSREDLQSYAIEQSGVHTESTTFNWKHKGTRPGNHPLPRIKQAAECLWFIHSLNFEQWLEQNPETLWKKLIKSITVTPSLGRERADILFGTVFLPAIYSLGNLFHSEKLKSKSWELWRSHRVSIPNSLLQSLNNTDLPPSSYKNKLGTIYQLRSYCQPKNCQNCKVFKKAIFS